MSVGGEYQEQESRTSRYIDPTQLGFLAPLWQQASDAAMNAGTGVSTGVGNAGAEAIQGGLGNLATLGNPQAQIDAQVQGLQSGLGDLFRNEINPALRSGAVAAGGGNRGRVGIAQAAAAGELGDAFTRGYGDIMANANRLSLGANAALGPLAQVGFQLGQGIDSAALDPLARLAAIIGNPAIVGESRSSGQGGGFNFGIDI